jgi:hypothetical protein
MMGFAVFTELKLEIVVFWVVTPYDLVNGWCLHIHGEIVQCPIGPET